MGNDPINRIDPDGGNDWVRNNETGEYSWDKNATSQATTAKGFTYVGASTDDVFRDFNENKPLWGLGQAWRKPNVDFAGWPGEIKPIVYKEVTGEVDVGLGKNLKGAYTVYKAVRDGKVVYWGITKNFAKRVKDHAARAFDDIIPVYENVSKRVARGIEQIKIETHGLGKLENMINSVSKKNPKLGEYYKDAISYLKKIGE
jgi:alkaline phosphatase